MGKKDNQTNGMFPIEKKGYDKAAVEAYIGEMKSKYEAELAELKAKYE